MSKDVVCHSLTLISGTASATNHELDPVEGNDAGSAPRAARGNLPRIAYRPSQPGDVLLIFDPSVGSDFTSQ